MKIFRSAYSRSLLTHEPKIKVKMGLQTPKSSAVYSGNCL